MVLLANIQHYSANPVTRKPGAATSALVWVWLFIPLHRIYQTVATKRSMIAGNVLPPTRADIYRNQEESDLIKTD